LGELRITQAAFADCHLQKAVRRLLTALEEWQRGGQDALGCEETLVQACGLLVARHTTHAPPPEAAVSVLQARRRLGEQLVDPPSLAELAAQAGVSRFQLLRRFAQVHGCTPHAWLTQQRCERARSLVRAGMGLADAAAACGFADQAHMTRLFTRQFGLTPGAWPRTHQGPQ